MTLRIIGRVFRKLIFWVVSIATIVTLVIHCLENYGKTLQGRSKLKMYSPGQGQLNHGAVIPQKYLDNIPDISLHNYEYLLQPDERSGCLGRHEQHSKDDHRHGKLLILFMVHSSASHFQHRKTIRETWGSVGYGLTQLVFLLGNPQNSTSQNLVALEHTEHGDIVQENFVEVYRNITLKNIMGMKWATFNCVNAKYVVKADDDVFVDSRLLIRTLINSRMPRKNLILCKIHFFKNVPREGKYAISESIYSENSWPSFCFGGCWIMSMDVVHNLYQVSLITRQIYLDDVYVTGILRTKLSLPISYLSKAYRVFCHGRGNYTMVQRMWNSLEERRRQKKDDEKFVDAPVESWTTCFL